MAENLEQDVEVDQLLNEAIDSHREDISRRKLYVNGLDWNTTEDELLDVFKEFGEIERHNIVRDYTTRRSKGFGFIVFKSSEGASNALMKPKKLVGNRICSCKLAEPSFASAPPDNGNPNMTEKTIFVGNVDANLDLQRLRTFFSNFGELEEGPLGLDRLTGKPRGFCFFVYKTTEGSTNALEDPVKMFEGHTLICQKKTTGPPGAA